MLKERSSEFAWGPVQVQLQGLEQWSSPPNRYLPLLIALNE